MARKGAIVIAPNEKSGANALRLLHPYALRKLLLWIGANRTIRSNFHRFYLNIMPKYFTVVDTQAPIVQNYFALVFLRGERVKQRVSLLRWAWLCLVEVFFGQELLESLVTTAANSGCPEDPDTNREYGEPNQLNLHIPSGLFTNIFRRQILQLFYYKFFLQYLFVLPVAEPIENKQTNTIDVTRVRFRLRKSLLYLVIPFRRVYLLTAVAMNLTADALTYIVTTNLYVVVWVFRPIVTADSGLS